MGAILSSNNSGVNDYLGEMSPELLPASYLEMSASVGVKPMSFRPSRKQHVEPAKVHALTG
jgi:hypothetical protein